MLQAGIVNWVRGAIPAEYPATIFSDTPKNPMVDAALKAAAAYRNAGCDGIVAVGGGSSMGLGKARELALTHGGLIGYTAGLGGCPQDRLCAAHYRRSQQGGHRQRSLERGRRDHVERCKAHPLQQASCATYGTLRSGLLGAKHLHKPPPSQFVTRFQPWPRLIDTRYGRLYRFVERAS